METQPETALQSIKDFKYPEEAPRAAEATAAKIQANKTKQALVT
jgi:hypothetical protein